MKLRRTALTATAVTAVAATALTLLGSPAYAGPGSLGDPAGDAIDGGLDITGATIRNHDYSVVVRVRFVKAVRGDLIVSIDPRRAGGVRVVSQYRPEGKTRSFVLTGAFTDRQTDGSETVEVPCSGLRVRWSTDTSTATVRMPSTCLHDGNYGAVRVALLTERGEDTDFAPENRDATRWIRRG
ncbi:MAG TPA: hypothetical protein VF049_05805 [Nocardioidaceae bacterium]|jgi:hypothetical protein